MWSVPHCRYSRAFQTQACALGRQLGPVTTWSLPAWPILGLWRLWTAFHNPKVSFSKLPSSHTPNELPDGFGASISEKPSSRSQLCFRKGSKLPSKQARVKPCIDQHLGATKITSDREIWLNYCFFTESCIPKHWTTTCLSFPRLWPSSYNTAAYRGAGQGLVFKNQEFTDGCNSALAGERRGRQNQFGTQPCSSGVSVALWVSWGAAADEAAFCTSLILQLLWEQQKISSKL